MKNLTLPFVCLILIFCSCHTNKVASVELDSRNLSFVDSLLSVMTLAEKIGQMNQYNGTWDVTGPGSDANSKTKADHLRNGRVGSMLNVLTADFTRKTQEHVIEKTRLGIPLIFGYDVIHGYKTMFPIPLAEACSWDMEAISKSARIAATEASASGLHWTFAPMVDVGRDARWGRVMEGAGEDPYLGSVIASARVRGFQGDDLSDPTTIAACAKHFAGYGFVEGGREYNSAEVTDYTMHNVVLPPFKACVDAGIATFMNGFNELGGQPVTSNRYLQRDLLKKKWGFEGFIISDYASIAELAVHGRAADLSEAAQVAVKAGNDMDMEGSAYVNHLNEEVRQGRVSMDQIDDAVRRILKVKEDLGLFDDPFKYCDSARESEIVMHPDFLEASRDIARKSIVLLKNENKLLPLSKDQKNIAVIGPLANDKDSPLGSWRAQATPNSAVSLLEGLNNLHNENDEISFNKGCDLGVGPRLFVRDLKINQDDTSGFNAARNLAAKSDLVILALGEEAFQTGEGRSQAKVELAGVQEELMKELFKVNKNIVLVLMNGRPLAIPWAEENIPVILETWFLGHQAGNAIADVIFGNYNPSGKLTVSFPRNTGQLPIYYNRKNTGRPTQTNGLVFWSHYTDESNDPLFYFGHGLSYTTFEYSKPSIKLIDENGVHARVSVIVTNSGDRKGKETVQFYIRDMVSSYVRPIIELKDFEQIILEPGESRRVSFDVTDKTLSYFDPDGNVLLEKGKFEVFVGTSSNDTKKITFNF